MTITESDPLLDCGCPENKQVGLSRRTLSPNGRGGRDHHRADPVRRPARLRRSGRHRHPGGAVIARRLRRTVGRGPQRCDPDYAKLRPGSAFRPRPRRRSARCSGCTRRWHRCSRSGRREHGRGPRGRPGRSDPLALRGDGRDGAGRSERVAAQWLDRPVPWANSATRAGSPALRSARPSSRPSMIGPNAKFAMDSIAGVKLAIGEDQVPLSRWKSAMGLLHAGARPEISRPVGSALAAVGSVQGLQEEAVRGQDPGLPGHRPGPLDARRRPAGEGGSRPAGGHRRLRGLGHARQPRPLRRRLDVSTSSPRWPPRWLRSPRNSGTT